MVGNGGNGRYLSDVVPVPVEPRVEGLEEFQKRRRVVRHQLHQPAKPLNRWLGGGFVKLVVRLVGLLACWFVCWLVGW